MSTHFETSPFVFQVFFTGRIKNLSNLNAGKEVRKKMRFWGKAGRREQIGEQRALCYLKTFPRTFNPITQAKNIEEIPHFLR